MNHDELVAEMGRRIDRHQLRVCRDVFPGTTWDKFFNVNDFLPVAAAHALRLEVGLPAGARCLDVGAGFGYVSLGLECLGHQCTAWDAPAPVLENVARGLPLPRWVFEKIERQKIGEMQMLTRLHEYDLIFLHGVVPMRDAAGWWEWPDYAFLALGLSDMLAPGGTMEWIINRGDQVPVAADPARWASLMETGLSFGVADNVVTVRRAPMAVGAV